MSKRSVLNLFSEFIYVVAFLLFLIAPDNIQSWDIAVASDEALNLFDFDGNIESSPEEIEQFTDLKALAFDPINQRFFFSVNEHNTSIFTFDLNNRTLLPVVPRQSHEVLGIAYDVSSATLFWTDGRGRSIWHKPINNDTSPPQRLLFIKDEITTGIAISFCKRLLFWTNSNHSAASIDRSNLDGSNHTKIITVDVFQPVGVTVDEPYAKIYWTDDQEGIYYRIERCNFDGTGRELIIRRTHQEPFAIVAANNAIYWTDSVQKNVWVLSTDMSFPNHTKARLEPDIFHEYRNYEPNGIAAYSDGTYECNVVLKVPVQKTAAEATIGEEPEVDSDFCLNGGEFTLNSCKCTLGFSGKRCESSTCYNYCLNGGSCVIGRDGFPVCKCQSGYEGSRCDRDVCEGYCLNGGRCYLNDTGAAACSCEEGFVGVRCELSRRIFCWEKCAESPESTICDCETILPAYATSSGFLQVAGPTQCKEQQIIIISLICFGACSMLVIVYLSRRVCILRRRPRIKKRIIVNKTVKSQTPMTVRPHPNSPTEQCEITIENCCNMNICETPCFEPNLRSSRSAPSSFMKKTEDRKKLLKNMEEEAGEFDGGYS